MVAVPGSGPIVKKAPRNSTRSTGMVSSLPGAVVGAAAGWPGALIVLFWVSVAGGLQAIAALAWARLRGRPKPDYVPYAIAIAAGSLTAWIYGAP